MAKPAVSVLWRAYPGGTLPEAPRLCYDWYGTTWWGGYAGQPGTSDWWVVYERPEVRIWRSKV
jgi:hypothetical protein